MKKLLFTLLVAPLVTVAVAQSAPFTVSQTILANTMTNVWTGPAKITSITIVALDATNATGAIIDTATNLFNVATTPYTNYISYATNYVWTYTNYYGVVTSLTNFALIDVTNYVLSGTFTYPATPLSALASATYTINPVSQTMFRGIWFTNNGPAGGGRIALTITGLTQ